MTVSNRSCPPGPVVPVLRYADVPAAVDWLCATFGFTEKLHAGRDHAVLLVGAGSVMLSRFRSGRGVHAGPADAEEAPHYTFVPVEDVDAHYDRVRRMVPDVDPPEEFPYGERQYSVRDPEGHTWVFSQSVDDVDPADWGAVEPGRAER